MTFLKKLLRLVGCSSKEGKVSENAGYLVNDVECEVDDFFLHQDESISDLHYIPGAWESPSLGRRLVDQLRDSPRVCRRAMNKMTSPLMRRKKDDEIYIVPLHVVHSSGVAGREDGRSDAW